MKNNLKEAALRMIYKYGQSITVTPPTDYNVESGSMAVSTLVGIKAYVEFNSSEQENGQVGTAAKAYFTGRTTRDTPRGSLFTLQDGTRLKAKSVLGYNIQDLQVLLVAELVNT